MHDQKHTARLTFHASIWYEDINLLNDKFRTKDLQLD